MSQGDRFLPLVLRFMPPETRDEVTEVFRLGRLLGETDNDIAVFLNLVREARVEWARAVLGVVGAEPPASPRGEDVETG